MPNPPVPDLAAVSDAALSAFLHAELFGRVPVRFSSKGTEYVGVLSREAMSRFDPDTGQPLDGGPSRFTAHEVTWGWVMKDTALQWTAHPFTGLLTPDGAARVIEVMVECGYNCSRDCRGPARVGDVYTVRFWLRHGGFSPDARASGVTDARATVDAAILALWPTASEEARALLTPKT